MRPRCLLWYTLGPASLDQEASLFEAGATGIRLTFSYGTTAVQLQRAKAIKSFAKSSGRECTVVADLAGEKVRLGNFRGQPTLEVRNGEHVLLVAKETTDPSPDNLTLPVPNIAFLRKLQRGDEIIVGDGSAEFVVTAVDEKAVTTEVSERGVVGQRRGLTVRKSDFHPLCLTPKDLRDLDHVLSRAEYDCVALSFVGSADDILQVRRIMKKAGRQIPIVAKIESVAGMNNLESICRVSDYVMAARGDLGLAIPWAELPVAVEQIGKTAQKMGVPWILATQIAEGLDKFAMLSRAEICDLARWLKQGACGVLLSHETAFGRRPLAVVAATARMLERWAPGCTESDQQ